MGLPCSQRVDAEELIDQAATSLEDIRDTLCDQAMVNRRLGGAAATLAHVKPLLKSCANDPIRILDAACGGADISRLMADEARGIGRRVEIVGLDLNKRTIQCARDFCRDYPEISVLQGDLLSPPFKPGEFDMVVMATFLHHLPPETVVAALKTGAELSRGWVVAADLVRSPIAFLGIHIFARLARFNPVSLHDGAISVCRAYTPPEFSRLAEEAGLRNWRLFRHRFYRMTLVYEGQG